MPSRSLAVGVAALVYASVAISGCNKAAPPEGAESISFRAEDGFRLEGTLFGSGANGVILAHMFPADQSSWFDFAEDLEKRGFMVLTFNFRGYGGSEGDKDISVIDRDVRSAVTYMRSRGAGKVGLIGASMGGTASLIAAGTSSVEAVVSISAPVEFMGLDGFQAAGKITAPKLFVAAKDDGEAAEAASRFYRGSGPPHEIKIVPGSDHGTDLLKGNQAEEVASSVIGFLEEAFG